MNKKILILSSSPRKGGNSDLLCAQFALGAKESGNKIENIFINDKNINYCTGCGICISRKKQCSQKDDMESILEKMIEADVIVMATPVYFYSMCGQMKTLIDRTCARYTEISNKDFYFIVTAADNNPRSMERTIECFRGFTACLSQAKEKGIIYATGLWEKGEVKNSDFMSQAYIFGKSA